MVRHQLLYDRCYCQPYPLPSAINSTASKNTQLLIHDSVKSPAVEKWGALLGTLKTKLSTLIKPGEGVTAKPIQTVAEVLPLLLVCSPSTDYTVHAHW